MQIYDCMPIQLSGFFLSCVEGIDVSKPPTMPLKFGRSFIRSMIFNSVAVGGFGGGPPVCLACLRASVKDFLTLCYTFPHLNLTYLTDLR